MDAETWAAVVSAAVAVLGLGLAAQQALAARKARRTAEVEIAELTGALRAALTQVRSAADSADAMVQRSKARATGPEIQTLARVTRAQLTALSADIERSIDPDTTAAPWQPGHAMVSPPPNQAQLPAASSAPAPGPQTGSAQTAFGQTGSGQTGSGQTGSGQTGS